ncbi:glucosidase 2 subunit beta-like isoform X1 [Magnolia sinica]|uniref:glucosidase 2 subunit beta-like isoform X1 n=1 Tax=Magnolia sinica TaxID=86752 RepID=UPI00265A04C2|nr:glucosidase 2 subunit beta-like isoform X1 [Magnolia sinica]
MKSHRRFSLLLASFCLISIATTASAALSKDSLLGVAPEDEKYYQSDVIRCKDGSKKFKKDQLNDEFCDCPDGTDEPGTSACPEGKFYCRNAGHSPITLFSSRVNDGFCDCCDGSDEYDGKVKCLNTCWEAGQVARDRLKKKITTYQEGVIIRRKEVEQAKQALAKDEAELSKLKNEEKILKGLVQTLKERKEQVEKAEEQERLEKEQEEKKQREAEKNSIEQEKKPTETPHDETKDTVGELTETLDQAEETPRDDMQDNVGKLPETLDQHAAEDNGDAVDEAQMSDNAESEASPIHAAKEVLEIEKDNTLVKDETGHDAGTGSGASSNHAADKEEDKPENTEGLSREELGRLVASRWTGENAGQKTNEFGDAKEEEHEGSSQIPDDTQDEDYDRYTSEDEDDRKNAYDETEDNDVDDEDEEGEHEDPHPSYDTDVEDRSHRTDFSENLTPSSPSWLDKIQQTVRNILQAVNLFKTPVDKSEAAQIRKEYEDSSQKLSKIQSRISSLTEKLKNDYGLEKEFYSFYDRCFENKQNKYVYKVCPFKQASQVEGHSTTKLGRWEKFDDSYRVMQFSNGDKCWNGPDRSINVRLRCGLNNELTDVDEPSRCEYVALLSTPAVCLEEKLKELQHKLDLMNTNQPQSHDEL